MYPKYKILELRKCTACQQKGYIVRKLTFWQKLFGMSEQSPCVCLFDFDTGDYVIESWVDVKEAYAK